MKRYVVHRLRFKIGFIAFVYVKCFLILHLVTANVLALGEEADFEAQNFQPSQNLIRSTNLQLSTETAFLLNACYASFLYLLKYLFNVSISLSELMSSPADAILNGEL